MSTPGEIEVPKPDQLTEREPIYTRNAATALGAMVTYGVARGVLGGPEETLAGILIPIVALGFAGWWARRKTTSVARAEKGIAMALNPAITQKPVL